AAGRCAVRTRNPRRLRAQRRDPVRSLPRPRRHRRLLPHLRRSLMADMVAERDVIREEDAAERLSELLSRARLEVSKGVVGHDEAGDLMLIAALPRRP